MTKLAAVWHIDMVIYCSLPFHLQFAGADKYLTMNSARNAERRRHKNVTYFGYGEAS
jgi:hypothetical protein